MTRRRGRISAAIALAMVAAAGGIVVGVWTNAIDAHFRMGPLTVHHWFSWTGASFIAAFTPAFYVLRRRVTHVRSTLLAVHAYGGLLAFMAVSLHFARHIARLDVLEPGAGIVLYSAVLLSVVTGLLMRHRVLIRGAREWRLLHDGAAVAFYLAVVVHVLVRLRLI